MLVTPIVFGGLLLGPTAVDGTDKDDRSSDPVEGIRILAACQAMVPALAAAVPVRQFVGLRPVSSTRDFILRPSAISDRLFLAAGIRSTGISTSPAVAEAVVDEVVARRGWSAATPPRTLRPPSIDLPEAPGEIVCLCRSISRGEIEAACRQPTEPRTLDAIKRRSGATFGDCQGNLCGLDVARIVAAERGIGGLGGGEAPPRLLALGGRRRSPTAKVRESLRRCRRARCRRHRPRTRRSGGVRRGDRSAVRRSSGSNGGDGDTVVGLSPTGTAGGSCWSSPRRGRPEIASSAVIVTTGGLFRAARASFDRWWPAGRRDDE